MSVKTLLISILPSPLRSCAANIESSPLKLRLAGDGAWLAFGQVASAIALLAGMRVLTEYVPPDTFGTVSLMLGILTLGSNLFCQPLLQAALRFHPELAQRGEIGKLRRTVEHVLWRCVWLLSFAIVAGGAVASIVGQFSYFTFLVLAALVAAETFRSLEMVFLNAAREQRTYAIFTALDGCARPGFAIAIVVLLGASAENVLLGYLAASGLLLGLLIAIKRPPRNSDEAPAPGLKQELWKFALPLVPLAIIGWVSSLSDRYIIGGLLGMKEVGVYAAAYSVASRLISFPPSVIVLTLRPLYFDAVSSSNKHLEVKTFRTWLLLVLLWCAGGCVMLAFCKTWVVGLLLAKEYHAAAELLPWIAAGYGLVMISQIFGTTAHAYKQTRWNLFIHSAGAAASIVFGILMIWYYGVLGAAMAVPVFYGIELLASIYAHRSILRNAALK